MIKNLLILICASSILAQPCLSHTVKQYDRYGRVTGYYRETSFGYTEYDKYGRPQGYYKQNGNTTIKYDKYGKVTQKYKQ